MVLGVSYIPGELGDPVATEGKIPRTKDLFTGTGYTQIYMGERDYEEFIIDHIPFTPEDIISYKYFEQISK